MSLAQALTTVGIATALGIGAVYVYHSPGNAQGQSAETIFKCDVSSITDGDTLRCADGTRVRLHAVAARESDGSCTTGHPCPDASAGAATALLTQLAAGQTLTCRQTGTTYGRKAAICSNESGIEINCEMVRSGLTLVWPKFAAQHPICGG